MRSIYERAGHVKEHELFSFFEGEQEQVYARHFFHDYASHFYRANDCANTNHINDSIVQYATKQTIKLENND